MLLLNGQPVPITMFPDKTSQVWKLPEYLLGIENTITWKFEHEGEFLHLSQLKALLDACGSEHCELVLPYLPYGRQDKNITNSSTFALKVFATLLNACCFDKVTCSDPHSEVAESYIQNFNAIYPRKLVEDIAQMREGTIFCYPDAGALKKYTKVYELSFRDHIYGEKVRDQATGNILSYKVVGGCAGQHVLIVDDICDGGMTFKLLAKDLLAAGAKSVVLFVTHGIFSKGLQTLKDSGIQRVFTQDGEASECDGQIIYRRL